MSRQIARALLRLHQNEHQPEQQQHLSLGDHYRVTQQRHYEAPKSSLDTGWLESPWGTNHPRDVTEKGPVDFQKCTTALETSEAYMWLLANLTSQLSLTRTGCAHRDRVRQSITQSIPSQQIRRFHPPDDCHITIVLEADILEFLKKNYEGPPHKTIGQVIVLIGSETNAQATTCEQYMVQTWPWTGRKVMECLSECLRCEASITTCGSQHP